MICLVVVHFFKYQVVYIFLRVGSFFPFNIIQFQQFFLLEREVFPTAYALIPTCLEYLTPIKTKPLTETSTRELLALKMEAEIFPQFQSFLANEKQSPKCLALLAFLCHQMQPVETLAVRNNFNQSQKPRNQML